MQQTTLEFELDSPITLSVLISVTLPTLSIIVVNDLKMIAARKERKQHEINKDTLRSTVVADVLKRKSEIHFNELKGLIYEDRKACD